MSLCYLRLDFDLNHFNCIICILAHHAFKNDRYMCLARNIRITVLLQFVKEGHEVSSQLEASRTFAKSVPVPIPHDTPQEDILEEAMVSSLRITMAKVLFVLSTAFILITPASSHSAYIPSPESGISLEGVEINLWHDDRYFPARVPAPPLPSPASPRLQAVTFNVNYNPASCTGTLATWPAAAQTAFNYAVSIWAALLNGSQPITVDACWRTDLPNGLLGTANMPLRANFSGVPSGTWYIVALANQLSGSDLNGLDAEMRGSFNGDSNKVSWYFGTDGMPPGGQVDFVSVVLHEIAHGLGFTGTMEVDDGSGTNECDGTAGVGCWGAGSTVTYPAIFDRFLENTAGQDLLVDFGNPSVELGNQLVDNNLFFNGEDTESANAGNPAQLYVPATWSSGSSVYHLDDATYNGTSHAMMTHALADGESTHHPGSIALGMLADMGWDVVAIVNPPPSLSIDDVTVNEGDAGTVNAEFTVSLSHETDEIVTVMFTTANNSASAGIDYTANSGTLTFPANSTSQTISVAVNGDTIDEIDETFEVNLSNPSNATLADDQAVGTIIDDDTIVAGATVSLSPIKDNTLYEDDTGSLSNGAGQHFFVGSVGSTGLGLKRRGVIAFDIAGNVPAGATVTSAILALNMSRTNAAAGPQSISLHRLLYDWGEGPSSVFTGNEGQGASAEDGDATWLHTFHADSTWTSAGGDFSSTVSASTSVDGVGSYSWGSTTQMVSDVQSWLDGSVGNYGWLLLGNESTSQTAKRFDTRENTNALYHPQLTVAYNLPTGQLSIVKDGYPEGTQAFEFHPSVGINSGNNFSLDADASATLPGDLTFSNLAPGTYTVEEVNLPASWKLNSIDCVPDNSTTVDLDLALLTVTIAGGDNVTCTFANYIVPTDPDLNNDTLVNSDDLVLIALAWKDTVLQSLGLYDFNANGMIDIGDFMAIISQFGN